MSNFFTPASKDEGKGLDEVMTKRFLQTEVINPAERLVGSIDKLLALHKDTADNLRAKDVLLNLISKEKQVIKEPAMESAADTENTTRYSF